MAHPNKGATKWDAPKMKMGPLEVKKKRSNLIVPDNCRKNSPLIIDGRLWVIGIQLHCEGVVAS